MSECQIIPFDASDEHYQAIAALAAKIAFEELPDYEYPDPDDYRDFDQSFATIDAPLQRYLALVDNQIIGYAQFFGIPWGNEQDCYWLNLRVDQPYRKRGIGSKLWQQLQHDLQQLGAKLARVGTSEFDPDAHPFAQHRGFDEYLRTWEFVLDTSTINLADYQTAQQRSNEHGIQITTLEAERRHNPQALQQAYQLHSQISNEIPIPGLPNPNPGLDWFEQLIYHNELALPDAYYLAIHNGKYVGASFLQRAEFDHQQLHIGSTSVDPAYRGQGIALALKLATIEYAQQHGFSHMWTAVEANNPSMLAINRKLGFQQGATLIIYQQEFKH